jgi:hypothetical protein
VWQLFLSIFPHLSGGTMATSQTCCHLPGELLNSAAECADRARIEVFESVELKLSGLNSIWRLAFNPTGIMHLEKYITQGSGLLAPGIYICKKERNLVCFLGKEMY